MASAGSEGIVFDALSSREQGGAGACRICGAPLIQSAEAREAGCYCCETVLWTDRLCQQGHFVCEGCLSGGRKMLEVPGQGAMTSDPSGTAF